MILMVFVDQSTKHWLTRMEPRTMSNTTMDHVDEVFRNRWRALLSVDDMVKEVVEILQKQVRSCHSNSHNLFLHLPLT